MGSKNLDDESRKVLIEFFQSFDDSGDGRIDVDELPAVLSFVGFHHTDQHVKDILRLLNKDGKPFLSIQDLVDHYDVLTEHSIHGDQLLSAFKTLDTNHDGYLDHNELLKILTTTGEKWDPEEASQLLEELMVYDTNHDGKFSYAEFVQMFRENSFPFVKPEVPKFKVTQSFKLSKKIAAANDDPEPSTSGSTT